MSLQITTVNDTSTSAIVTNPANENIRSTTTDANILKHQPSAQGSSSIDNGDDKREAQAENTDTSQLESSDQKNDSSTLSTAFTISFEDGATSGKKLFGIRDSIRKFAPPKPNTIEKPRSSKNDSGQENSYMSIESAPGNYTKNSLRRELTDSCGSSGRKSNSSRHSNISESAAFLIDKMLNCKSGEQKTPSRSPASSLKSKKISGPKKFENPQEDVLEDEIDFWEDKSDNGTYIVGADPESDAARKKIDELFGVVKAAEASLIADSKNRAAAQARISSQQTRPLKTSDKRPISQDRQNRINRLAIGRHSSRSSSSSRQDVVGPSAPADHRPRAEMRRSRNSSCDRVLKSQGGDRHRRAASQSSRHSSNHEPSEGDTRSSRSSLHHDIDVISASQPVNALGMKFNRAFALRRARLGLTEPNKLVSSTSNHNQPNQEADSYSNNVGLSPKRNLSTAVNRPGASSLSRNDGGRFSLRMKNSGVASRLSSLNSGGIGSGSGRISSGHHGAILVDNYINKVSASSRLSSSGTTRYGLGCQPGVGPLQGSVHVPSSYASLPYNQSGDELESGMSPSRYKNLLRTGRLPKKIITGHQNNDLESDLDPNLSRLNYSIGNDNDGAIYNNANEIRAYSSAGRQSSSVQLGALDSLVISAISGLSAKIRGSVCDLMVEHAKRLPVENETRLIVEEIMPQLSANSSRPKSPLSIEEIDQSLYFDLAQTLKNLKKVEQMVDVMKVISDQIPNSPTLSSSHNSHSTASKSSANIGGNLKIGSGSNTNSEVNSLSPV